MKQRTQREGTVLKNEHKLPAFLLTFGLLWLHKRHVFWVLLVVFLLGFATNCSIQSEQPKQNNICNMIWRATLSDEDCNEIKTLIDSGWSVTRKDSELTLLRDPESPMQGLRKFSLTPARE